MDIHQELLSLELTDPRLDLSRTTSHHHPSSSSIRLLIVLMTWLKAQFSPLHPRFHITIDSSILTVWIDNIQWSNSLPSSSIADGHLNSHEVQIGYIYSSLIGFIFAVFDITHHLTLIGVCLTQVWWWCITMDLGASKFERTVQYQEPSSPNSGPSGSSRAPVLWNCLELRPSASAWFSKIKQDSNTPFLEKVIWFWRNVFLTSRL